MEPKDVAALFVKLSEALEPLDVDDFEAVRGELEDLEDEMSPLVSAVAGAMLDAAEETSFEEGDPEGPEAEPKESESDEDET